MKKILYHVPVKLRYDVGRNGVKSLYLDIYMDGKRKKERLKLYIQPGTDRVSRMVNAETMRVAEEILEQRLREVQDGTYDFESGRVKEEEDMRIVVNYYRRMMNGISKKATKDSWKNAFTYLSRAIGEDTTFDDVDVEFVDKVRRYLTSSARNENGAPLSNNSQMTYFAKFRACINAARAEGLVSGNPLAFVKGIRREDKHRVYLTIDEVRLLNDTVCRYPRLKRAFLFSCLTGLRRSDVFSLTWGEVFRQGNFTRIIFRQKKTSMQEYLDISEQAVVFMGERGADDERVFPMTYNYIHQKELREWARRAGVNKEITFHSARHTFAVLMLDIGTDIYTVSKLLGHRELTTTQVYAQLLDKNKQAAVSKIPMITK